MMGHGPMKVLLDCHEVHGAANRAFKAIGLKRHEYRPLRKRLRRWGIVEINGHIIERIQ